MSVKGTYAVEYFNPETGRPEIYQTGLGLRKATELASRIHSVNSPRWFGVNAPARVIHTPGPGYAPSELDRWWEARELPAVVRPASLPLR